MNTETSLSATNVALVDVTGDGLPDYLARKNDGSDFLVMVNTGYGFTEAVRWSAPPWPAGARKPEFQGVDAAALRGAGDVGRAFLSGVGDDGIDPLEASGTHGVSPTMGFVFTVSMQLFYPVPWLHRPGSSTGRAGSPRGA